MQRSNNGGNIDRFSINQISDRVKFSIEQTAKICAVTRRQLSYWTKKGIISGEKGYNLSAVEKVLLIKKHLDSGNTLRQAVARTDGLLRERAEQKASLESLPGEQVKEMLSQRLDVLEQDITKIKRVLPVHTSVARLNRLWTDLAALSLDDLFNQAGQQPQPIHETIMRLDDAIGRVENIVKELEEGKVQA